MRGVALPRRDLQRIRALKKQNVVFEENDVKNADQNFGEVSPKLGTSEKFQKREIVSKLASEKCFSLLRTYLGSVFNFKSI